MCFVLASYLPKESTVRMSMSVLFVCLGNICRSPLVAAVARSRFAGAGLSVTVDSCGTGGWHVDRGADPRSIEVAEAAGYRLREHRARQLQVDDFERFDWLLAMDDDNLGVLHQRCPAEQSGRVRLFLAAADIATPRSVPDPYYGELEDFELVLRLAEQGVDGLVDRLRAGPASN